MVRLHLVLILTQWMQLATLPINPSISFTSFSFLVCAEVTYIQYLQLFKCSHENNHFLLQNITVNLSYMVINEYYCSRKSSAVNSKQFCVSYLPIL